MSAEEQIKIQVTAIIEDSDCESEISEEEQRWIDAWNNEDFETCKEMFINKQNACKKRMEEEEKQRIYVEKITAFYKQCEDDIKRLEASRLAETADDSDDDEEEDDCHNCGCTGKFGSTHFYVTVGGVENLYCTDCDSEMVHCENCDEVDCDC
jgi:hypothetical protein